MRRHSKLLSFGAVLIAFSLVLAACEDGAADTTAAPETAAPEETEAAPETTAAEAPPVAAAEVTVPFLERWTGSGHNDVNAEAFRHWDEDDPPVIPSTCARCHSQTGHLDFLGVDGSAFGSVEADVDPGTTISCVTCHNDVTLTLDSVEMPSGLVLTGLGREARCMNCHQGRHSTVSVNAAIEEAGADDDEVSEDLGFLNIHYYAAAASKYGTEAKGGYEYDGKTYDAFFTHVEGYTACHQCHDPHTLELKLDECATCHSNPVLADGGGVVVDLQTTEDLKQNRMPGSQVDYDGDGDITEGMPFELEGLREKLLEALQLYAEEVSGTPIVYDSAAYPYFFIDTDGDGEVDGDEAAFPNQYNAWTPRLLKAAYNYQVSLKDPGDFAHGGKYHIQLMYDSIENLNEALSTPVSLEGMSRIDHGHFAGSEEAFRHWDEDDPAVVPGGGPYMCARCHSAGGLPLFLEQGVVINQPPTNGFLCSTCHNDLETYTRHEALEVTFPSGKTVDSGDPDANLCMTCHQGRESAVSVNNVIGDTPDDTVSEDLRFVNIHYFAAGATLFGTEAMGGYEYEGNTYAGRREHVEPFDTCTECHDQHKLEVKVQECSACHSDVAAFEDLKDIRLTEGDFDGDGNEAEGIYGEIDTLKAALLAAIQDYTAATDGVDPVIYSSAAYPYFFIDSDGDGEPDDEEAAFDNRYVTWTPRLLRAAYNYQYASKDPGGFAHNPAYVLQLLYDSLADIGGDTSGMTRP